MKIRATGILIEDEKILLLNQNVNESRSWSLPGGTLEERETLKECLVREMQEETGLVVEVQNLLYVCDLITESTHVVHITFLIKRLGGTLGNTTEGLDTQIIRGVEMVPIADLEEYGFSNTFKQLVLDGFPRSGSYMGPKSAIGL